MAALERAIEIAFKVHGGQVDKAGQPYILHPLRLMFRVSGVHEQMAAVLHDVVEDTLLSLEDLRCEGFPEEVIEAVNALTKRDGETRIQAPSRCQSDSESRENRRCNGQSGSESNCTSHGA